jgi:hypothetical protein
VGKGFKMRLVKLDKAYGEILWFVPEKSMKHLSKPKKINHPEDSEKNKEDES